GHVLLILVVDEDQALRRHAHGDISRFMQQPIVAIPAIAAVGRAAVERTAQHEEVLLDFLGAHRRGRLFLLACEHAGGSGRGDNDENKSQAGVTHGISSFSEVATVYARPAEVSTDPKRRIRTVWRKRRTETGRPKLLDLECWEAVGSPRCTWCAVKCIAV